MRASRSFHLDFIRRVLGGLGLTYLKDECRQVQVDFVVPGVFMSGRGPGDDLLRLVVKHIFKWELPDAALKSVKAIVLSADSGASGPEINVDLGGTEALSADLEVSGTEASGTVDTSNNTVSTGDRVKITVASTGSNGDAEDLTVRMLFEVEG